MFRTGIYYPNLYHTLTDTDLRLFPFRYYYVYSLSLYGSGLRWELETYKGSSTSK